MSATGGSMPTALRCIKDGIGSFKSFEAVVALRQPFGSANMRRVPVI